MAAQLIGHWCLRWTEGQWVGGMIIETEAYLAAGDEASHSRCGITKRNQSMFGDAAMLYVYSIHAKYCLNVVTERRNVGSAVLIRALWPTYGIELMQRLRGQTDPRRLTAGPAMICQALGVTTADDGIDLMTCDTIRFARNPRRDLVVHAGPRIGISRSRDLPLRFVYSNFP